MSAQHKVCNSFKLEILQGIHDLRVDELRLALYESTAAINENTTAYTSTGESSGTGYSAGGNEVSVAATFPQLYAYDFAGYAANTVAILDFDDVSFTGSNITARYGLIYNASKSNRAVACIDFGREVGSNLVIQFPEANPRDAIIGII